ncbi:hypothetical protein Glove_346g63 [Diversispora epigaea]|uniref:Aminoalcoholphosphotransferase n=1 Tax=Diversispora epigaea TaxID=1348612 RepID=A0A397HF55_9GLOM|nr:hypothetical protein Glove_346g63 [Diversispora epigaea]
MAIFTDSDYTGEEGLKNLKHYKYSAIDKSPISNYVLKPYWNWAIGLFPMWMAPNLITLSGLSFVFVNVICIIIWIDDLVGPGPRWIYWTFPISLWLYSTFDNVDGKQARRTGTSSPLGELFDHGCDALNCTFGSIVLAASLGLGHSEYVVALLLLTIVPFYFSTWEEYHTGTLYLGYCNGPTEGVLVGCLILTISAITGPSIWTKDLRDLTSNTPGFIPMGWTIVDILLVFTYFIALVLHCPPSLYNVYQSCKRSNKSYFTALSQLSSITIYSLCTYFWLSSPNSYILRDKHLILFAMTIGIVFGRMATKIILAHLTKMPYPKYTVLLIPLLLGTVLTNIPRIFQTGEILSPAFEHYYLWGYFIFTAIAYFHWAILVINRFCSYLKINCFRIPHHSSGEEAARLLHTNQ